MVQTVTVPRRVFSCQVQDNSVLKRWTDEADTCLYAVGTIRRLLSTSRRDFSLGSHAPGVAAGPDRHGPSGSIPCLSLAILRNLLARRACGRKCKSTRCMELWPAQAFSALDALLATRQTPHLVSLGCLPDDKTLCYLAPLMKINPVPNAIFRVERRGRWPTRAFRSVC